jgi:hypothetical protein
MTLYARTHFGDCNVAKPKNQDGVGESRACD